MALIPGTQLTVTESLARIAAMEDAGNLAGLDEAASFFYMCDGEDADYLATEADLAYARLMVERHGDYTFLDIPRAAVIGRDFAMAVA